MVDRIDTDFEALKAFVNTQRQREHLDAIIAAGSIRGAARSLDLHKSTLEYTLRGLRARVELARRQEAIEPMGTDGFVARELTKAYDADGAVIGSWVREGPEPQDFGGEGEGDARDGGGAYLIKGVSTYFGAGGEQRGQWVKTKLSEEHHKALVRQAIREFMADVEPIEPAPLPAADKINTDVIPWVNVGDGHIGMLAHEAEVGENFDLKIAERELCAAIATVVDEMGLYDRIVLNDLGDMTHYENMTGTTEASGHQLDFDSRYPRMIRTYSRVMRFMVDRLLTRCNTLDVILNRGNHSETNDIWMAELLRVAYGASGRVNVLDNDSLFIGYRMGNTLVMTHHSHKAKPADLAAILAGDFRRDWGETEYHYVDIGHIHHSMARKELNDCVVESWNTLAGKDRYAHDNGYRARQSLTVVYRSRTYGERWRRLLPVEEIRDRIAAAHTEGPAPYSPKAKRAFQA